jgi:nucleoside 2-deoxyribosyltransferase
MKKIYLASPYTGTSEQQADRFDIVCQVAGKIILDRKFPVFSPIAHSHPIATRCDLSGEHDFWIDQNRAWLEWADEVWVAMIDGWKDSKGVQWEVEYAKAHGMPVGFVATE